MLRNGVRYLRYCRWSPVPWTRSLTAARRGVCECSGRVARLSSALDHLTSGEAVGVDCVDKMEHDSAIVASEVAFLESE